MIIENVRVDGSIESNTRMTKWKFHLRKITVTVRWLFARFTLYIAFSNLHLFTVTVETNCTEFCLITQECNTEDEISRISICNLSYCLYYKLM